MKPEKDSSLETLTPETYSPNTEESSHEITQQSQTDATTDESTEITSEPSTQTEDVVPHYNFKINGKTTTYSHNDIQKALAAEQGFQKLEAERENWQTKIGQERKNIEEEYLNRILVNMPEFLQNYQNSLLSSQTENLNNPTTPQSQPLAPHANLNPEYIKQLEDTRDEYGYLLNELQEQAESLQAEETQNFFSNFFEQHEETNPTIKNIFFEILSRLQEEGHDKGDYNEILKASRHHHNDLITQTLQQTPPETLVTILGEQNLEKLNNFFSSSESNPSTPSTDPTLIQINKQEVVPDIIL